MPRNGAKRLSKNVKRLPAVTTTITTPATAVAITTTTTTITFNVSIATATHLNCCNNTNNNNGNNNNEPECIECVERQIRNIEKCEQHSVDRKSVGIEHTKINISDKVGIKDQSNGEKQDGEFEEEREQIEHQHENLSSSIIECCEEKEIDLTTISDKISQANNNSNFNNFVINTTATIHVTTTNAITTITTTPTLNENRLLYDSERFLLPTTTVEATTVTATAVVTSAATVAANVAEVSTIYSTLYPIVIETTSTSVTTILTPTISTYTSSSSFENLNETNINKHSQCHTNISSAAAQLISAFDNRLKGEQQQQQHQGQQNEQQQKQTKQKSPPNNPKNTLNRKEKVTKSSLASTSAPATASAITIPPPNKAVSERLASLRKRKIVNTVATGTATITKKENAKRRQALHLKSNQFSEKKQQQHQQHQQQQQHQVSHSLLTETIDKKHKSLKTGSIFNDASGDLNRIEPLNEHNVKRSDTKRKRNHSAVIFRTVINTNRRRKRNVSGNSNSNANCNIKVNSNSDSNSNNNSTNNNNNKVESDNKETAAASTALGGSLNISKSKKRPRIMSLYDSRFQTSGNDGRSVLGNGYLTSTTRGTGSNSSSGILNDINDGQDMANQYYLSNAGTVLNSSQAPFTNSNGSSSNALAVNHAPSMAALCNIGNSCYLNSVVYTLRFAPQFLHNLHHLITDLNAVQQNIARARSKSSSLGRGMNSGHMESARSWSSKDLASMEQYNVGGAGVGSSNLKETLIQKNSHQLLAEKLHELYQSLYRNEITESTEPHHADTLLRAIQDVSAIFEGNQQQDAHEFLMCILNSIRETSQTLIKAIAECPDVLLNGYILNPDETSGNEERDAPNAKHLNSTISSANNDSGNATSCSSTTSALSALTSGKPSLFSRKSKRKEESKNSKNARLRSPLKEGIASGILGGGAATANSLFYLNSNDLNPSPTAPTGQLTTVNGPDEPDVNGTSLITSSLLKDKQRLADKIRELGLDFFSEDFEGITVSTTKCLSCETVTEQKETMIDIAVPVPQAGYESNECTNGRPNSFIQNSCITREYFRNENKYRCEQCTGYTEAIRSISYEVLPRLLVIQLSRFSGGMEKINSYIPTSFTLQCFCSKCCELSDGNKLHIYKLYSVITHVGATMSVGHYIAYTCSLDWANEYINCPKDLRRRPSQERSTANSVSNCGGLLGMSANTTHNSGNSSGSSITSTGTSFMKKMKFGRSKASSSGDMSKNVKHLNGLIGGGVSKVITNGIGKLSINSSSNSTANSGNSNSSLLGNSHQSQPQQQQVISTTCQGINCCAMRLCAQQQQQQLQAQHQPSNSGSSASDFSEDSSSYPNGCGYGITGIGNNNCTNNHHTHTHQHQHHQLQQHSGNGSTQTSGYGSIGRGGIQKSIINSNNSSSNSNYATANGIEPIWYMCDDDKIKAMTQREFEELLSPTRKITVTPYLLFYAKFDLQPSPPKANVNHCGNSNSMMTTSSSSSSTAAATIVTVGGNDATLHTNSYSTESLQSGSGSGGSIGVGNGSGICSGNAVGTMGLRL